jgi:ankyrin repeat protein
MTMKCVRLFSCMIVSVLILSTQPGRADIKPMDYSIPPTGAAVSPKSSHPTIRLDDQEVIIRLKRSTYTVDAVFHLSNTGETTTEWIGFPKNPTRRRHAPLGGVMDFIRFEALVHEEKVPFTEKRDLADRAQNLLEMLRLRFASHSGWLMGKATFPGHGITTIRVSYEVVYDYCGFECEEALYTYGTGGYWKGYIGKASFIVDSTEKGGAKMADAHFSVPETKKHLIHRTLISENIALYEIRDFEPKPDDSLSFMFLIGQGGNRSDKDALVTAAMSGRLEQVQALLDKGVNVNAQDRSGNTPLMAAALGGHVQVAKVLLEKGANVNAAAKGGLTALNKALQYAWMGRGQLEVAKLLKDHGAKPTTLAVAAFVGDMDAVQRFSAVGVNLNEKDTPGGLAPLTAAALGGQPEVAKFLLDKGQNLDALKQQGQAALIAAAAAGHVEVVRVLLDRGADVNERSGPFNRTILMHAVGYPKVVKVLLERGADVNAQDRDGATALSLARGRDIEEIEKVLLAHGAKK